MGDNSVDMNIEIDNETYEAAKELCNIYGITVEELLKYYIAAIIKHRDPFLYMEELPLYKGGYGGWGDMEEWTWEDDEEIGSSASKNKEGVTIFCECGHVFDEQEINMDYEVNDKIKNTDKVCVELSIKCWKCGKRHVVETTWFG